MNKHKIKVVHIVEGFIGGLATYMYHVLPRLSREGFDVTLVCSLHRNERGMDEKLKSISEAGVVIQYIPMHRGLAPFSDIYCFVKFWKFLKKNRFDVIHAHCSKGGFLGRLAAVLAGIETRIYSSHCFAYLRSRNVLSRWSCFFAEKMLGMFTTKYVAVSSSEVLNASGSGLFPKQKIILIENGVPVQETQSKTSPLLKSDLGIPNNLPVIVTGCRLIGYKGLDLLLKAIRYVNHDCRLVIAGEGALSPHLQKYITKHCLKDRVFLLKSVMPMQDLFEISDIAVLCSKIEAQSFFLLEAMLSKCPIIATDVPGNRELVGSDRGVLVKPFAENIADAIGTLLSEKLLRERISQTAYDYVIKNHPIEKQVRQLSNLYLDEFNKCIQKNYKANEC